MPKKQPLRLDLEGTKHEGHGRCLGVVHQYPLGWDHVNRNELNDGRTCAIDPRRIVVNCCRGYRAPAQEEPTMGSQVGRTA